MADYSKLDQLFSSLDPAAYLGESGLAAFSPNTSPIKTFSDDNGLVLSAISDRLFLRWIVEKLLPLEGRRIFEIGTGTGYFATLLGRLCGPAGAVYGCEIISSLYAQSTDNRYLAETGNVFVHHGDFVDILPALGTFDILIATSSLSRIPRCVIDSCRPDGGRLALPIEIPGGGDCFTVFERQGDRLSVKSAKMSISVPSTGAYSQRAFWARPVTDLLPNIQRSGRIAISCIDDFKDPIRDSLPFRSYLFFHENRFDAVNFGAGTLSRAADMGFGLFEEDGEAAILRRGNSLLAIGRRGLELAASFSSLREQWHSAKRASLAEFRYTIDLSGRRDIELVPAWKGRVEWTP
jgi:protein-L-isoaspartate O-methyltransferase